MSDSSIPFSLPHLKKKIAPKPKKCYSLSNMSLTRKVAHNTLIQFTGKIVSTLLGVIAIAMLTRYLGAERYGWYTTAITFLQFGAIVIDFGLIPVTAQMLSETKGENKTLFQNLLGFRITTAFLFFFLAPLISLFFNYPPQIKIAIAISAISFLGTAINQILIGYYQYKLKMYIQAIGEVVSRVVLIGGLFCVITASASFLNVIWAITFSGIAYTAVLLFSAAKDTPLTPRFDPKVWKAISVKMWPIALSIIFNVVYLKGDVLILTFFRSQTEVGIYGSAYRVVDIMSQTAMMFMGVILPLLAAVFVTKDKERFARRYQKAFDGVFLIAFPVVVGMAVLATPLIRLIAGEEFTPAGIPLQILSLAVLGVYIGSFFGHVAVAINQQKRTLFIYITCAVLTLTGYLVFIPKYGMFGAAWMSVFSELFVGIVLALVIYPLAKVKLNFSIFLKALFASGIMGVGVYFLSFLPVLALVPIGAGIYGGILFLTQAINRETIQEIIKLK